MKKSRRRGGGARKFFTFLGVLISIGAVSAIALRLVLTPERLQATIIDATADATGLDVRLDDAHLSFLPFGVSITGLRLSEGDTDFLELGSGLVRLDLIPLLQKRVVVDRLTLRRPRLRLRKEGDEIVLPGTLAEARAGSPSRSRHGSARGFEGSVRRFEIVDGSFLLETPGGAEDVALDGIGIEGSLDVEPGGATIASTGTLSLAGLSLSALDAYRETLDTLRPVVHYDVSYRADPGSLHLERVRLVADPLDLAFRGDIHGLPDAPEISLTLDEQTFELAELLPLIPPAMIPKGRTPEAKGPVTLSARVVGPLGRPDTPPTVTGLIRFDGADLGIEGFPTGIVGVEGSVTATPGRLEFTDLKGRLGEGSFAVTGAITGLETPDALAYDLTVKGDLDLAVAASGGFVPEGTELSGRLDVDVAARGTAPEQVELHGSVKLRDARYRAPEMTVPVHDLEGTLVLEGPTVQLTALRGGIGSSSFSVTGAVEGLPKDPRIRLTGRAPVLDLVELGPGPSRAPSGPGRAEFDPPSTEAPLVPPLPPFRWNVRLSVDSLVTAGGSMHSVELTTTIRDRKARVEASVDVADFDGVVMSSLEAGVDVAGQTVRGDFHSPRVAAHQIPLTSVQGLIDLGEDRVLHLDHVVASVWTGRVEGSARVDLRQPDAPVFDIETNALGLEANDFVSGLTAADGVLYGKLDIRSRFSGRGATANEIKWSLKGEGAVATHRGRLAKTKTTSAVWQALNLGEKSEIPFEDLATSFSVRDGRLFTQDLAIAGNDADWKAAGSVGFDGELDYDVQVELSEALSRKYRTRAKNRHTGDLVGLLANSDDRLVVDFRITGKSRHPDVAVDYDKLAKRAANNAVDQVGEKARSWIDKLTK